ncbi:MAG TPA: DUF6036 family nucleotidyltransferase [Burkholderiales bacterium]|nr:DUF6036 family nucleotidyltransferase [Burkholderiales bacterium]
MKAPALHSDPRYLEAFGKLMKKIERALPSRGKPVRVYVAGGAALHLYTGARYSRDIDARIDLPRLALPADMKVAYEGPDGLPQLLYYDMQYNESSALLHEDAHKDSVPIEVPGVNPKRLDVRLFSPVDLAVSKLSRFEAHDQEDILALAKAGLIDADSLQQRALEALPGYVGHVERLRNSLGIACRKIKALQR